MKLKKYINALGGLLATITGVDGIKEHCLG